MNLSIPYPIMYNPEKRQLHSLSIVDFCDFQCSRLFLGFGHLLRHALYGVLHIRTELQKCWKVPDQGARPEFSYENEVIKFLKY